MSEQSSALARLFGGFSNERRNTIAFELAGGTGAAWVDGDGELALRGEDFLMRQAGSIGGGTTEMAANVISERVLGMPRERVLDKDVAFRDVPHGPSSS
jgi:alkylation response protein AidB-like acyl-CoA dehydrogenase